jgi:hypothetical protein
MEDDQKFYGRFTTFFLLISAVLFSGCGDQDNLVPDSRFAPDAKIIDDAFSRKDNISNADTSAIYDLEANDIAQSDTGYKSDIAPHQQDLKIILEASNVVDKGTDAACKGDASANCYTGPPGTVGVGLCKAGIQSCNSGSWGACIGQVIPSAEICDNKDNNCNGATDELLTKTCYSGPSGTQGVGLCKAGIQTCSGGAWSSCSGEILPSTEICDNKDNDCDGQTDENLTKSCYSGPSGTQGVGPCKAGIQSCSAGVWGNCSGEILPSAEICDNKDNNCSGSIDESLTQPCYSGPSGTQGVGLCKGGTQTCSAGIWGTCSGEVVPTAEICDGKDNNCDSKIDETFANLGQSCTFGVGECKAAGVYQCKTNGSGTECSAKVGTPTNEICDNKDNDCDGKTDEDALGNPLSQSCYTGPPGTLGVGLCKAGNQTCLLGIWSSCAGEIKPTTEICDGKDNDCDGTLDDGLKNITFYKDFDGDSYGDPAAPTVLDCSPPPGYSANNKDCDDNDPLLYPGANKISTLEASGSWGGVGSWTSLALDSAGKFHISYYDGAQKSLKYATNASGSLVTSYVNSPDVGSNTSIALDSKGKVHIAYKYCQNSPWCDTGAVRYATNALGTWSIQTIDSGDGYTGDFTSLAIDKNDNIHLAYRKNGIMYATNAGGSWTTSVVDSGNFACSSIAVDASGKAHVSYCDVSPALLKYANNTSGLWAGVTIDTSSWVRTATSIAVDSGGKVHIAYSNSGSLRYITNASAGWKTTGLGVGGSPSTRSLFIDSKGSIHISYEGGSGGFSYLGYATNIFGSWQTSTLETKWGTGSYSSIGVAPSGKVHISYYYDKWPSPGGDLKYLVRCN